MHTHVHMYTYVYVYIYVYGPSQEDNMGILMHLQTPTPDIKSSPPLFNPSLHMSVCMYRHMYVHIYIYIDIRMCVLEGSMLRRQHVHSVLCTDPLPPQLADHWSAEAALPPDSRLHWRNNLRGMWYSFMHWAQPLNLHLLQDLADSTAISTVNLPSATGAAVSQRGTGLAELPEQATMALHWPWAED